jgi:hypothetical protein
VIESSGRSTPPGLTLGPILGLASLGVRGTGEPILTGVASAPPGTHDARRTADGGRRTPDAARSAADQTPDSSLTCVRRNVFPDGSWNPESIPYGRSSGTSENSTPRLFSCS